MKSSRRWPAGLTQWVEEYTLYISVPFTWNLPEVAAIARQGSFLWNDIIVGGPALQLLPDYLGAMAPYVMVEPTCDRVLQRVHPQATKTTVGCIRSCKFCAVPGIEGAFRELDDWPDLPILIDNNLLAASTPHLDRVFDRLEGWGWADFNQGLDARLLTEYHAERLERVGRPMIRLALDHAGQQAQWERAYSLLREHGTAKSRIRSYALIGFDSDPLEAWDRCDWIEGHGVKALPMWFHELDALERNTVTTRQEELGWSDYERRRIMQWFYQHKVAVRGKHDATANRDHGWTTEAGP